MIFTAVAGLVAAQLQLDWHAPDGCPDEAKMKASVERWLGEGTSAQLTVRGEVTREADGPFTLTLDVAGKGTRRLEGQSCVELTEAGALVLALLLDPGLLTRPVPAAPAPRDVGFELGVSGVGDYGALPSVAPGWHASLGFTWKRLRVEAFGGTFLSQHAATMPPATFSLDFDAGLRPCVLFSTSRVQPMVCVALAAGRGSAHAEVNMPLPATSTFAALYAGLGVAVRLFWQVSVLAHLEAGAPLIRDQYVLENTRETVWVSKLFAARGELGLQVKLW